MKLSKLLPVAVALATALLSACQSNQPENIAFLQHRLHQYRDNGDYIRQFSTVAARAKHEIETSASHVPAGKKPAVVFDIDETLLSNWPYLSEYNFGGNMKLLASWIGEGKDLPFQSTRQLYEEARKLGYSVFLISGRRENLRAATIRNLQQQGLTGYARLSLRPMNDQNTSVIPFKSSCRKEIEDAGYLIVMSIGDQWSDLKGGYAEHTYKLPNPFYYIK